MITSKRSSVSATNLVPSAMTILRARVVIGSGRHLREMLPAEIDDTAVDLAERHDLKLRMLSASRRTPPSPPPTMSAFSARPWANSGTWRHHLVIDELVLGRQLHHAIEHHHPPEIGRLEDDQMLMLGLAVEEDAVGSQACAETAMQRFFDPAFHLCISLPRKCSFTSTLPGVNASLRTSMARRGLVSPHMNTSSAA